MFDRIEAFISDLSKARSEQELGDTLGSICSELGFRYFALTHHVDIRGAPQASIRVDNYPVDWVEFFDAQKLGPSDPVHRASHLTSVGFAWSQLPGMIRLTARDRHILEQAVRHGIGSGFTIPAHVPGESAGSCSFATRSGVPIPHDRLPLAQLVGAFAFEAARRLSRMRHIPERSPPLTERQLDCVAWAARGKSDWEIATILGVSKETVIMHLKQARGRYRVGNRTSLTVHALFDGTVTFGDIFRR